MITAAQFTKVMQRHGAPGVIYSVSKDSSYRCRCVSYTKEEADDANYTTSSTTSLNRMYALFPYNARLQPEVGGWLQLSNTDYRIAELKTYVVNGNVIGFKATLQE